MNTKKPNPTTATNYELRDALRRVVRPYRSGSAYGVARVESHDGSRTVVHGLHERSKQWANVREVERELNRANLQALGLAFAGETNRHAARFVLRTAYELTPQELDTAAVLVCDALGQDPEGTGHTWDQTPPVLHNLVLFANEDANGVAFSKLADVFRAAVLLNK